MALFTLAPSGPVPVAPVTLAQLTTLRTGGPVRLVEPADQDQLVAAVMGLGRDVLVLGGGSNVVCGTDLDGLTVVRDRSGQVEALYDAEGVTLRVQAGAAWDGLVQLAVDQGWAGFEALSGIPGSVGATAVQNVGAYGHEVSELITGVKALDRASGAVAELDSAALGFGYRNSVLKATLGQWGPTPRHVILEVTFRAGLSASSWPLAYGELAGQLGLAVGDCAPLGQVRRAVLALRRSKGMVLDAADHDTWSAGSFFTNPIVTEAQAAGLPSGAPRFAAGDGLVKTSAAWLIGAAGVAKGWGLDPDRATTSTKHVLALTNRGQASGEDIMALARAIQAKVQAQFGIALTPEPVLVGL
jgi:UDP-N-acetylmuramate dehydrogenase